MNSSEWLTCLLLLIPMGFLLLRVRHLHHLLGDRTAMLEKAVQEHRQMEEQFTHFKHRHRTVAQVNQLIAQEKNRDRLMQGICDCLTERHGYFNLWIALLDHRQHLKATFQCGLKEEQFREVEEQLKDGCLMPCFGKVLERGAVVITEDPPGICTDCLLSGRYSGHGAMTACISFENKKYGFIVASLPVPHLRNPEEKNLFLQVAEDIAFALHTIDLQERHMQLQQSMEKARRIVENSPCVSFRWRAETGWPVSFVSRNVSAFGYTPEDFLSGRIPYASIIHPDDLERVAGEVQENTKKGAERFEQEYRIFNTAGRVCWVKDHTLVERDAEGTPLAYQGVIFDITDRKTAEQALVQSEREKAVILDSTAEIFVYYGKDLRIRWTNRAAAESTGLPQHEMIGRYCYDLWHQRSEPCEDCPVMKVTETNQPEEGITRTPDGRDYLLRAYPVFSESGELTGIGEFGLDVTDQRKLEEQLRHGQKMEAVGRLAGGVAHDLNNLLSPILGYGDMLLQDRDLEPPVRDAAEVILRAGNRARDLVRQLLAFGRKQTLKIRKLNLNTVISDFENLLRWTIREDIRIHTVLSPTVSLVHADAGQMEQVIMNLAINAQDAMPEGGVLTIETAAVELDESYAAQHSSVRPGQYVQLAISDTGIGMDAETQKCIFEPFYTTKEKGKGTGLGLATVFGIVKQHGGNIWVYSEPGGGTTFRIYLPEYEGVFETVPSPPAAAEPVGGDETVLLVEDDDMVRQIFQAMLESLGYRVMSMATAEACLNWLENGANTVDLLLTDVVMPDMNGRELSVVISRFLPQIKVLFMSGYTDDVIAECGVLQPGIHFLQKPFSRQALAEKLRDVLR